MRTELLYGRKVISSNGSSWAADRSYAVRNPMDLFFADASSSKNASPTMSRLSISSALRKLLADSSGPAVTGNEHLSQQSKTLLNRRVPLCTFPIARRGFQRRLVGEADQILGFVHAFACRNKNKKKRYEKTFR